MPWDSLTNREQIGLAMLVAGNLIIAVQLGKYGRALVASRGAAWMGTFIVLGGLFTTGKGKAIENWWWIVVVLTVAAFMITRLATKGSPQVGYERALLAMKQWTQYNYAHLKALPEKGIRPGSRGAAGTLADLQAAIAFLSKDNSRAAQLKLAIAQLESGLMLRMMNVWDDAAIQFDASIARLERLDREPPSDAVFNALNMNWSIGSDEGCQSLALLVAIDQSFITRVGTSTYPDPSEVLALRAEAPHRRELVRSLAAALFRRAELYHVRDQAQAALPFYRKSLAIHEGLKEANAVAVIRKLMNTCG